jgi:5'-3' exonuclease
MDIVRLNHSANDTTIFYMIQEGYLQNTNHDAESEIQCQTEIRKGKAMMNTELERQKRLKIMKRRLLAESVFGTRHHALGDKDDFSSTLRREDLIDNKQKQMLNKEDKKQLFLVLCRAIKGAFNPASIIRYTMARIDVTLEDGTIVAKTTKIGIEENLLERNPKVYRAAGLTPFGDTDLGRRLGPYGFSPLETAILEGSYEHYNFAITEIVKQLKIRYYIPMQPKPIITERDYSNSFGGIREVPASSPFCLETEYTRASTLLSWVALWALGFVRASVRARNGGCGSGSSLTHPRRT